MSSSACTHSATPGLRCAHARVRSCARADMCFDVSSGQGSPRASPTPQQDQGGPTDSSAHQQD
eukprot:6205007-Pleurochrysis_carterae.AAC.2